MVTLSTALTIFIMNIHHSGPEARPVPRWAERFVLNYLAQICFVHETGESCLRGVSSRKKSLSREESEETPARGTNWGVNGQVWGGRVDEDGAGESPKVDRDSTKQTVWTQDLFVTIDHSEEKGAAGGCEEQGEDVEEKKSVRGQPETQREVLVRTQCVCQNQQLHKNVEYIANSYQDQRVAQLHIAEWRKVAKVMDRFFMWLFIIMFFFMSIFILGKAI